MIVAKLFSVAGEDLDETLHLADSPFPGDTVATKGGDVLLVIRRRFVDRSEGSAATHDLELGVRLA